MGYFPNGVVYKKGGVASAFNKVKTNELDNRSLFQVKGKRRPRLVEVDCEWNSFNEGDVFILDYKNWLIQWNGKEANRFEKLKACQSLQELKARNGKQTTVVVEQGRTNKVKTLYHRYFTRLNVSKGCPIVFEFVFAFEINRHTIYTYYTNVKSH